MLRTNINGTAHLVQACLETGFEAFLHAGSSSEYGFKDHAPSEQEILEPNSHYAVTKAAATLFCRQAAQRSGLRLTTLRLYSVYGPYEEATRLIPTVIAHGLRGTLPSLVDPSVARDFVYIRDVEEAFMRVAACTSAEPGAVYNLGTGVQTSIREVVEVARKVLGIPAEPAWGTMPNRTWDSAIWVSDSRKIQATLNWKPRYSFEAGFSEMVACFQQDAALRAYYAAHSPETLTQ
jgi:nucleoside-diphosphate-sugar epimerase